MSEQDLLNSAKTDPGFTTDYRLDIATATFTTDVRIANGEVWFLQLAGQGTREDGSTFDASEKFMLPKGWLSYDGGATITHPTAHNIPAWCGFGKLLDWFREQPELVKAVAAKGVKDMKVAAAWVGEALHLNMVEETYMDKKVDPPMQKTSRNNMPDAYLGATTSTPAAAAPPVTREALAEIAKAHDTHAAFYAAVTAAYPTLNADAKDLWMDAVNPDGALWTSKA